MLNSILNLPKLGEAYNLMRLMVRIDRENYKQDILTPATLNQMYFGWYNWIHFGELPGTNSGMTRLDDTFSFSFIVNRDIPSQLNALYETIKQLILARTTWPTYDLF